VTPRERALAIVVAVLGSVPLSAHANGRAAAVTSIAVGPVGDRPLLAGTTFGALVSSDDGASWRWICEPSIYGGQTAGVYDLRLLVTAGGRLLVGTESGLYYSRDGGCSFAQAEGALLGLTVADVAASPADPRMLYAVSAASGRGNGLFVSHDEGEHWQAAAALDDQVLFRRVTAAGSDAFASGFDQIGSGHHHLYRYRGGDGSFTQLEPSGVDTALPFLDVIGSASAGTEPVVFLAGRTLAQAVVYRSVDGAGSFTPIFMTDFIRTALYDGRTVWVGADDGLHLSRDGAGFVAGQAAPFHCLTVRGGPLYACPSRGGTAQLQRSDDGLTFQGLLSFHQNVVGTLACPAGTPTHDLCEPLWPALAMQLGIERDAGVEPTDAGSTDAPAASGDANATPDGPAPGAAAGSTGCGCHVGGAAGAPLGLGGVLLLVALQGRRRARA
jgi:MYXO-CTERM domain-containing protein